ncbi:MAG: hypothetical protein HEEMFOPI_00777 [Holosporales bacterium]
MNIKMVSIFRMFVVVVCVLDAPKAYCMRGYEVLVHDPIALPAFNMAANDYNYLFIRHNHNSVIPSYVLYVDGLPLVPAPFIAVAAPIVPPAVIPVANIALAVVRRNAMGMQVRGLIAASAPAILAAPGAPLPLGFMESAIAGGYLSTLACFLQNLTNPIAFPVLPPTNRIIIHISLSRRISKNMDELKNQSTLIIGQPTIKSIINNIYIGAGIPVPNSVTIVSYTN